MGFVPGSFELSLVMLIVSMFGWGSWANTLKKCGNWRFEAWYIFYIIGSLLSVTFLALTLGMIGQPTFLSVLTSASQNDMAYATAGGIVWGIGNILLIVSIVIAGFAFAFPIGIGIAIVLGTLLSYLVNPSGNPFLLFVGVALIISAIISDSFAYRLKNKRVAISSKIKKGIVASILTGILVGIFPFFLTLSLTPKGTLDSYAATFFFTAGAVPTTFLFLYLLSKLRLTGEKPLKLKDLKAKFSWYVWGLLAGVVWAVATVFNFTVSSIVGVSIAYPFGQGATMVAAIWGIFVWKELKGAPRHSWILIILMFALFISGLTSLTLSFR